MFQPMIDEPSGDWHSINSDLDKIDAVGAADVKRVANESFSKESRTVGVFLRKQGAAPADPEL